MLWFLITSVLTVSSAPATHLVTNLPGVTSMNFNMYSGYLQIPNSMGKELHYVFCTSQNNPVLDPVVLWLNGGPGCSSMEGAFMENGPFVFSETNTSMYRNPYSWNTHASMLYIEAPAGVGYSMMGNISNNFTTDNITAEDNLQALLQWFSLYPEFSSNKFYISEESYAGIYVPTLAYQVITYNALPTTTQKINLVGFLVGNGVTNWNYDADSAWPYFLYWHALIDDSIWVPWVNSNCSGLFIENDTPYCQQLYGQMLNLFTEINYYDIYRQCISPNFGNASPPHRIRWNQQKLQGVSNCAPDNSLTMYLNNPKVRNALHINTTVGAWEECADIDYQVDYALGSYYLYPTLVQAGLQITLYSGDTDSAVPTIGTRAWLNELGYPVTTNWTEWMLNGQVAGFFMRYSTKLRFVTIRGSGHMCIQWKRPEGYQMFMDFLQNINPSTS